MRRGHAPWPPWAMAGLLGGCALGSCAWGCRGASRSEDQSPVRSGIAVTATATTTAGTTATAAMTKATTAMMDSAGVASAMLSGPTSMPRGAASGAGPSAGVGSGAPSPVGTALTAPAAVASRVVEPVVNDTIIVLDRGGCEAHCPDYRVSVFASGRVLYEGRRSVRAVGTLVDLVEHEKVRKLVEALRAADFFGLVAEHGQTDAKTCTSIRGDAPTVTLSVTMDGRSKTVTHHHRCLGPLHEQLVILEDKVDRTANSARWVR